jgi:5-methylcytosine-specific restriction endonuclease McrA
VASRREKGLDGHDGRKARLAPPDGEPCPYCFQPMWPGQQLDADHVVPRVYGGGHSPLRWAHSSCNRRAGQKLSAARRRKRPRPDPGPAKSQEW